MTAFLGFCVLDPHLTLALVNKLNDFVTGVPPGFMLLEMNVLTIHSITDLQLPDLTTVTLLSGMVLSVSCKTEIVPPTCLCDPEIYLQD